jgi:hypothetical protein
MEMLQKKATDLGLVPFLPAFTSFIREVHKGCGRKEVSTRKEKKTKHKDVILMFFLYFLFQGRNIPICMN